MPTKEITPNETLASIELGVVEVLAIIRHKRKERLQLDLLASGINDKASNVLRQKP